jgi:hypothetical protein
MMRSRLHLHFQPLDAALLLLLIASGVFLLALFTPFLRFSV